MWTGINAPQNANEDPGGAHAPRHRVFVEDIENHDPAVV
jgi:hypothetical protein